MAKPTLAQVKPVNNLVTDLAQSFLQSDDRFVGTRAVPSLMVEEESGTYIVYDQKYIQADQSERRAYGDTYAQGGFTMSTATYVTLQYGLEHPIPDEIAASNQGPLELETYAAQWHAQQMAIRREVQFASAFMTTGVWGTDDNNSANDWDTSTGTPVTNVLTAKRTISQASGQAGNIGICGEIVWDALLVNAEIESRLQYTRTLTIMEMEGLIAAALGLENLYVSKAIRNTANLAQTASYSAIIDDDFLVLGSRAGGPLTPTAARLLFWNPGGGLGQVRSYYSDERDATITKHKQQWVYVATAAGMGYFFADIV